MKVLLGLVLFIAACEAAVLVTKECLQGPSYWCKSYKTAKLCGALEHCMKNAWKKPLTKVGNACEECTFEITAIKEFVASKEFDELLRVINEGLCYLFVPDDPKLHRECNHDLNSYIAEIVNEVNAELANPGFVCSQLELCPKVAMDHLIVHKVNKILNQKNKRNNGIGCNKCKDYSNQIKSLLNNTPKQVVLSSILEACEKTESISTNCKNIVGSNFDIIYNIINKINIEDICKGNCNSHYELAKMTKHTFQNCASCQYALGEIKSLLVNGHISEQEFKQLLIFECEKTGGTFEKGCEEFVNAHFQDFYENLLLENGPKLLCDAAGYCRSKFSTIPLSMNLVNGNRVGEEPKMQLVAKAFFATKNKLNSNRQIVNPSTNTNNVVCDNCITIFDDLKFLLNSGLLSERDFKQLLLGECQTTGELGSGCEELVNQNFDVFVTLLKSENGPSQLCTVMGECSADAKFSSNEISKNLMNGSQVKEKPNMNYILKTLITTKNKLNSNKASVNSAANTNNAVCDSCTVIFDDIKFLLDSGLLSENDFKQLLLGECKTTGELDSGCEQLINENFDAFLTVIRADNGPALLCTAMGECSDSALFYRKRISKKLINRRQASEKPNMKFALKALYTTKNKIKSNKPSVKSVANTNDAVCDSCTVIFDDIKFLLDSGLLSENDFKQLLLSECKTTGELDSGCEQLINENFDAFLIVIRADNGPALLCTAMGECTQAALISRKRTSKNLVNERQTSEKPNIQFALNALYTTKNKINLNKPSVSSVANTNDAVCDSCTVIFDDIKFLLDSGLLSENDFKQLLLGECKTTGELDSGCEQLINENFDAFLTVIRANNGPALLCTAMGECTESANSRKRISNNLVNGRQTSEKPNMKFALKAVYSIKNKLNSIKPSVNSAVNTNDAVCDSCTAIFDDIKFLLDSGLLSEDDFKQLLLSECRTSGDLDSGCEELVNQNFNLFVTLVKSENGPVQICRAMGECKAATEFSPKIALQTIVLNKMHDSFLRSNIFVEAKDKILRNGVGTECDECKDIMTEVNTAVQTPVFTDEMRNLVAAYCIVVVPDFPKECFNDVSPLIPQFIKDLSVELEPNLICNEVGACPKNFL